MNPPIRPLLSLFLRSPPSRSPSLTQAQAQPPRLAHPRSPSRLYATMNGAPSPGTGAGTGADSSSTARAPKRRKLFVPTPLPSAEAAAQGEEQCGPRVATNATAGLSSPPLPSVRNYILRRRSVRVAERESLQDAGGQVEVEVKQDKQEIKQEVDEVGTLPLLSGSGSGTSTSTSPRKRRAPAVRKKEEEGAPAGSTPASTTTPAASASPSPRKAPKPIKLSLAPSEVKPAPKRWRAQLDVLSRQRSRISAPVDTMGCGDAGHPSRRADTSRAPESPEEEGKRERFTVLVSLMLSSQTKDEVTAQAVRNLQLGLSRGLCLAGVLEAPEALIAEAIAKVGFWRRKTGYLKAAAARLRDDFAGDVPRTVDELCSLPGVGPKMAFLALQEAWGLNVGIGVDVHVHRLSNRLGWCRTSKPEDTRLALQSWLPKELHGSINKTLVGFGQVVCVPVGPRCE